MKILCLAMLCVLIPTSVFAGPGGFNVFYSTENPAEPDLKYPASDSIDITGQKTLKFRWDPHVKGAAMTSYYDFRLYKGYDMYEKNLIMKQRLQGEKSEFEVNSDIFESGQIYTWSLRAIDNWDRKSRKANQSFKVKK